MAVINGIKIFGFAINIVVEIKRNRQKLKKEYRLRIKKDFLCYHKELKKH